VRLDQAPASAAAHLPALSPGVPRFVSGPLVRRSFFVCGTSTLARDFALLFGGHRRESSPFFSLSSIHRKASVPLRVLPTPNLELRTDPFVRFGREVLSVSFSPFASVANENLFKFKAARVGPDPRQTPAISKSVPRPRSRYCSKCLLWSYLRMVTRECVFAYCSGLLQKGLR
jgi:hypothetical protein